MKEYNVALRPIHYACVSGGKDSLFMFRLILEHPDKYPLDMVVNYELETDFPSAKNVVNYIESCCNQLGVKFVRIKPRKNWEEWYNHHKFYPSSKVRWCNNDYKLDCTRQLKKWIKEQNCRPVAYIGLCADETKRFKYNVGNIVEGQDVIYPLAEENINEDIILEWASNQYIFEGYYKIFKRQGCMMCPLSSMKERAYVKLRYPEIYKYYMGKVKESEEYNGYTVFSVNRKYNWEYQDKILDTKWVPKLIEEMKEKGVNL